MSAKLAKLISIITVVPIVAIAVVTAIYLSKRSLFNNDLNWYLFSLLFLGLIPISAYGLKNILPPYKHEGRSGERKLAFILCAVSFVLGAVLSFIFKAPVGVKLIFLGYTASSLLLSFSNGVIKFKASGHACGVAGPLLMMVFLMGHKLWYTFLLLPVVFWSRLKMGRHTMKELCSGALVGLLSTAIVFYIFATLA